MPEYMRIYRGTSVAGGPGGFYFRGDDGVVYFTPRSLERCADGGSVPVRVCDDVETAEFPDMRKRTFNPVRESYPRPEGRSFVDACRAITRELKHNSRRRW